MDWKTQKATHARIHLCGELKEGQFWSDIQDCIFSHLHNLLYLSFHCVHFVSVYLKIVYIFNWQSIECQMHFKKH